VVPESDVEDVTQEVFLAAFKSLSSFRGEAQFSTWLRTLTNRKVAEYYRKRNRKSEAPEEVPLLEAIKPKEGSSSKLMEDRIALRKALNQISDSHREVILLRFVEGLQFNEIADLTGQNLEAVKSLFRRAISALRNYLDE
jgi:RNA polymerase sigma-70 factor (ECF subfamily)